MPKVPITLAQIHHGRSAELMPTPRDTTNPSDHGPSPIGPGLLVNLTSHPIYLVGEDSHEPIRCIFPSKLYGELRLQQRTTRLDTCAGMPIYGVTTLAAPTQHSDLPPRIEGTLYIVSRLVADVLRDRDDFVFPYRLVRDGNGVVTGCSSLARFMPTSQEAQP